MKKLICTLSGFALALGAAACTGMYAGRLATVDGTTLLGRTVDYKPSSAANRVVRVPAGTDGNRWTYICTPKVTSIHKGQYAGGCVNEAGLMCTCTVTADPSPAATNADPYVSIKAGGVGEPNLPGILAGNCATARAAVERLGLEIAARGHSGGEIYMFADRAESWYVEVYTGHQWAAVKMPEDQVACFGNQFMLNAFPTNRADAMFSPELVKLAATKGFAKWADREKGVLDLNATYSKGPYDGGNYRTWYGHHVWAPDTAGVYATNRVMQLFYKPAKKLALRDLFEMMRTRYEGSGCCPDEVPGSPHRVIGVWKQGDCQVVQMRHDIEDAKRRATLWNCTGASPHGVFIPVNASATAIHPAFSQDQTDGDFRPDPRRAGDAFRALAALAEARTIAYTNSPAGGKVRIDERPRWGNGLRRYWSKCEDECLVAWPRLMDGGDVAALTSFTTNRQARAYADARRFYDDLLWYAIRNVHVPADGGKVSREWDPPFECKAESGKCP